MYLVATAFLLLPLDGLNPEGFEEHQRFVTLNYITIYCYLTTYTNCGIELIHQ